MSNYRYDYETKVVIKRNRPEVLDLFFDYTRYPEWMPTLLDVRHVKGTLREQGRHIELVFNGENNTPMIMHERIESNHEPHKVIVTYQMGTTLNRQTYYFESYGSNTMWLVHTEFEFDQKPPVLEDSFKASTKRSLQQFKRFVESQ